MPVNPQGIWTYSDSDIVQSWPAFMNLGFNTVSDVIKGLQQNRVLIANRGEIALRVVRTVRDLGGTSILPYTPEDLLSPAAELADEAHALPEGSSYTHADAILDLARATGADAIHPGYGFLSENSEFARAVEDAGIAWLGPSSSVIDALGDKINARRIAQACGVAPVPGVSEPVTSRDEVEAFIEREDVLS